MRHLEHVEAAHLEPVAIDDRGDAAQVVPLVHRDHGMAGAAHGAQDAIGSEAVLHLLRDVAPIKHAGDIGAVERELTSVGQDLAVRVRDHDRVADHLGGVAAELLEVIGAEVGVEELLAPHGELPALAHEMEELILEIARRELTAPEDHGRGRLAVALLHLALHIDEEQSLAFLGRPLLEIVRHRSEADDAFRAPAPLRRHHDIAVQQLVILDIGRCQRQLIQDRTKLHCHPPDALCSSTNIVAYCVLHFGARAM